MGGRSRTPRRRRRLAVAVVIALSSGLVGLLPAKPAEPGAPAPCPRMTKGGSAGWDGLTLNGSAQVLSDVLRATPATTAQAGSAWTTDAVPLGSDGSFSAAFAFQLSAQANGGADGLVFAVQSHDNAALGEVGGKMGFADAVPPLLRSVGVEFDSWFNAESDDGLGGNHIGIDVGGTVSSAAGSPLDPSLENLDSPDATHHAWVDYDGSADRLEVRFSEGVARPAVPKLTYTVDLPALLESTSPFFGFTSGTGSAVANHDVLSWELRSCFDPVGDGVGDQAVQVLHAVPNPDTPGTIQARTRLAADPGSNYELMYLGGDGCVDGHLVGAASLGSSSVTTDANGTVYSTTDLVLGTAPKYLAVEAVSEATSTSVGTSRCTRVGPDNDAWTRALPIPLSAASTMLTGAVEGYLDSPGQARWYTFAVQPGSTVKVDLTDLAADYDLALFRDIARAFDRLSSIEDLTHLSAEFAPSNFTPSNFTPSNFTPSNFTPSNFTPSNFTPSNFTPSNFTPSNFTPSNFTPSNFTPSSFTPSNFTPSNFTPVGLDPSVFSPETFTGAQTRSLVAVSATTGTADESIVADTWLATGSFYIRVSGRNGAFDASSPFTLDVTREDNPACAGVAGPALAPPTAPAGTARTIILTNPARMPDGPGNSTADKTAMRSKLDALAARPDVQGVVVDLSADPRVTDMAAQADAHKGCVFATNLLASAIKDVIDAYRAGNPLQYVVLAGNDAAIPFFRYPDQAELGPESDYVPPVHPASASEASLRLNYILGQDEYGARSVLTIDNASLPVPDLAVGRLVETATEVTGMVDAYLGLAGGVVPTPARSLVTGYDFLVDAANSVASDLTAGTGAPVDQLITPANVSPADPSSWTADQLRAALLGSRHDLVYLAGHFSANSALAADFSTSVLSTELATSPVDMTNSIIFSAGCHSGYNIVDSHAIPGVTETVDWAQAFARRRATLIAGTGYQYGDTDFLEYSERIYAGFAHQLRVGTGAVAVGDALMRSKRAYLSETPDVRGLHRKAVVESALFGMPMLSVDLPAGRIPAADDSSAVAPTQFGSNPGATLGLHFADASIASSPLVPHTVTMRNLDGSGEPTTAPPSETTATYFEGPGGVVTNPSEPALPLVSKDVSVPGQVLRGVGFRGGNYADQSLVPLTGAAATEIRGVHTPFSSTEFFPRRLTTANHFGSLNGGDTRLLVTPVQHRVAAVGEIDATARVYSNVDVRLFYSSYLDPPALSDAPSLSGVESSVDGDDVVVRAHAVGNPAAGIQEVWATYTGLDPGTWASLDLVQCVAVSNDCAAEDSTLWVGRIAGGAAAAGSLRLVVQAVNGVGLVTLDDNSGSYYSVAVASATPPPPPIATALSVTAPASGPYGATAQVTATLSAADPASSVAGRLVLVSLGATTRAATTDSAGQATVTLPLTTVPGDYDVRATFAGAPGLTASDASAPITVTKVSTAMTLTSAPSGARATLTDANGAGLQRTIFFVLSGPTGTKVVARNTNLFGQASLGSVPLAPGNWTTTAMFLGTIPFPNGPATLADATYLPSSAVIADVVYAVRVLQPAANSVSNGGSSIPVRFTLSGPSGGLLPDAEAAALVAADNCRVKVSAAGAQTLAGTCARYEPRTDTFQVVWNTSRKPTGSATLTVSISYPGASLQTVDIPIRLR